jgi:excisionase family DNA binding protein
METDVMTVKLCDYLRVHKSTIYRLLRTDGIPAFRVGSDWRFTRSRIDKWCAERHQNDEAVSFGICRGNDRQ